MARKRVERYHAARSVRFSTTKRNSIPGDRAALIRPWRDGLLAGVAVAAAISLGATVVYQRAKHEKQADVHHHLLELARRLSQLGSVRSLDRDARELDSSLLFVRDNTTEARRIYTFALEDDEPRSRSDTGIRREATGARPLPPHALRAREHFRSANGDAAGTTWSVTEEIENTAFALITKANENAARVIAIEADTGQLLVELAAIRSALWFTCLLGLIAGAGSGFVVWRLRMRAATVQAQFDESRRVEEAIIASLGEVVYTYDPADGRFRWRGNVRALLGLAPPPEGIGREEWIDHVHPEDRARYAEALDAALADSLPMNLEYRVRGGDTPSVWMLDRGQPVHLGDGRRHLAGSLTDLTARRRAEEALRIFFEGTATAHLAFDGDLIVDANPAAVELFGAKDMRTLLSQPAWALWPRRQPDHALSVKTWSDRVMQAVEAGPARFEWQFLRFDGSHVDCDVFLRLTIFEDREVLMMGCADISPAKRAQAQLIESEQRFRDVSNAIGEFVWEVDAESRYIYASSRVRDVLGLEPAEVLGRSPFEFVPEEDRAATTERSREIRKDGQPFRDFEHRIRQPDGTLLWIRVSGAPCYNAEGAITGYRGASLDITKHRAYEQELMLQKEAAEAAGRAKSSFLAMMSHEIRTPLNSVLGFADLVLDSPLTPTQRDYLETIRHSGDALLVLLNDILDFSKIESGQMEVEIRATDLPRCIREVLDLYTPSANAKNLTLTAQISAEVPREILTDPSRLRQILINLVGNAVKFTATGSVRVEVSLLPARPAEPRGRIRILVADTGIGINREQQERLFKPFTQADSSTTRRFGGTGLGLAISKRLADLLGGELGLETNEPPGAKFFIDLPAAFPNGATPTAPEAAPAAAAARDRVAGHDLRVLVVDDNTLNRRLTSKLLHVLGAETDTAASAEECFEKIAAAPFDVVLMDVQMPGTDGMAATRQLRDREAAQGGARLFIVALTADAMVGDRERCLAAGMDDYLTKPLRREDLARVLMACRGGGDSA